MVEAQGRDVAEVWALLLLKGLMRLAAVSYRRSLVCRKRSKLTGT